MIHETEDQIRLRRAKEALQACQMQENQARKALADAVSTTKRARERHEELFLAEEKQEVARRQQAYNSAK